VRPGRRKPSATANCFGANERARAVRILEQQRQGPIMNMQNQREIIVSGIHLELTPSLKIFVREKADRLFRHEEHIVRLRVELECDSNEAVGSRFKAKGHINILGPDMNAQVSSDECHKAVALLVDKLDRMLRRRSRLHKVKRKHTHPVEFDVAIPKAY
jgi:putative sigma-54 modulation protein